MDLSRIDSDASLKVVETDPQKYEAIKKDFTEKNYSNYTFDRDTKVTASLIDCDRCTTSLDFYVKVANAVYEAVKQDENEKSKLRDMDEEFENPQDELDITDVFMENIDDYNEEGGKRILVPIAGLEKLYLNTPDFEINSLRMIAERVTLLLFCKEDLSKKNEYDSDMQYFMNIFNNDF